MASRGEQNPSLLRRRHVLGVLVGASVGVLVRPSGAEDVVVPVDLQAELLAKVAGYDRNLPSRAGNRLLVLVVVRPGDLSSERVGGHMARALQGIKEIAGIAMAVESLSYSNAGSLAASVASLHASVVYLSLGFDDEMTAVADGLTGVNVLTLASLARYVPKRAVVGFDLVSGRPKILVNLTQARAQHVAFSAELLKLARIYE